MAVLILISIAVFLLIIGGVVAIGLVLWLRPTLQNKGQRATTTGVALAFRWRDILLPLAIFLLSLIVTIYFYPRLPPELAYHFQRDGSPDRWLSRGLVSLWLLLPQLFLTLLALVLTWGITKLSALFRPPPGTRINLARIRLVMGNMVVLPQIILGFAMLDIFSYNSYQIHLLPLWVFALIVMGLGAIILGIFFVQALSLVWGTSQ